MIVRNSLHKDKKQTRLLYLIIVIYAFILYGNTIPNYYSLDDDFVIYKNERVQKGIKGIPEQFATNYSIGKGNTYGYRPITRSFFAIEYDIFGENPHISHLINILLYALTGLLLFTLLRKFLFNYSVYLPFFVVLVFMSHPVHTEVVAGLKNREELFSFLGGLGALWSFYKFTEKQNWLYFIPGILLFIIAYLSKENVLVFAALIPLSLYFFTKTKIRNLIIITLLLLFIVWYIRRLIALYLPSDIVMNYWENPLYVYSDLSLKIIIGLQTLFKYFSLLIFPNKLLFYYGFNTIELSGLNNFKLVISAIIHLSLLFYAIIKIKRKSIISYGILFYLIAISMFSNLYVPVAGIVGERLIYVASFGFSIAFVFFIFKLFNRKIKDKRLNSSIVAVLLIVIIAFSIKTISRNNDWKNTYSLLSGDIEFLENSARANVLYAGFLMSEIRSDEIVYSENQKREMLRKAIKHYKLGLKVYDKYPNAYKNLGNIYFAYYKDYKQAKAYFLKALETDTLNSEIILNLGYVYETEKEFEKAEKCYNKVLIKDKLNIKSRSLLANLLFKKGDLQKAIALNNEIIEIDTTTDIPFINIGNYYLQIKDTAMAVFYWEKAIKIVPDNSNLLYGLQKYFEQHNDSEKALYYKDLIEVNQ